MKQHLLRATAIVALSLAPAVAMAQSSGTSSQPQNAAPAAQSGEMQASQSDSEFAKRAAAGGQTEVELGKLASEQSKNEDVTAFGETLVDDHTEAGDKLKELAADKGIELPGDLPAEGQEAKQRLAQMTGGDFDRAFIEQMVGDHKRTIDLFEKEAQDGQDADLKAFAENTLPTLRAHLDEAQRIEKSLSEASAMQTADSGQPTPATKDNVDAKAAASGMPAAKDPGDPKMRFQAVLGEVTAKDLIGKTVVNASGAEVGEIDDIVINDADVVSAVVSVGGFLGIGAKQVAVPFEELQAGEDKAIWQTNATEEELKNMPAYEQDSGGFLSYPSN